MDPAHDPGTDAAGARAATAPPTAPALRARSGASVLVGVASWTDPTMTARGVFYPEGVKSPEARLRHYASRFPLVEVDSTYYAIPARRMAEHWVERTPEHFTFNVKAHALMTGQPSEVARLPRALREALPASLAGRDRIYATDLPAELVDEVWRQFLDALEPLREARRLGAVLLQFPRWVDATRGNARLIVAAGERLRGWPVAVELRNHGWFEGATRDRTLALLREHGLAHVAVDGPPGFESSVPFVAAVTTPRLAMLRFHGRNTDTWEAKVTRVADRFRYLYDETQIAEWLPAISAISEQAEQVHLVFNNCYGNYGTTNALETAAALIRAGYSP